MDIYLDNNILVSIENGDFSLQDIISLLSAEEAAVLLFIGPYFSKCGTRFKGNETISAEALRSKRFGTIRTIFANNYLYINDKNRAITYVKEDPQVVYNTITLSSIGIPRD